MALFELQLYALRLYTACRVPLIMRNPATNASGVVEAPVSQIDIVPTILSALGKPVPEHLPGLSLLDEAAARQRKYICSVWERSNDKWRMIVGDDWKYAIHQNGNDETLFNLADDPAEVVNLAASAAHQSIKADLRAQLIKRMRALNDPWACQKQPG